MTISVARPWALREFGGIRRADAEAARSARAVLSGDGESGAASITASGGKLPDASEPKLSVAVHVQSLEMGGAEIAMLQLATRLRAAGYRVAVVVQAERRVVDLSVPSDIDLVLLRSERVSNSVRRLAAFMRDWSPDVVVSALPHNNLAAIAAAGLSGRRVAVVVTEHAPIRHLIRHYGGWRYRALPTLLRWFYPFADAVIGASEGIAAEMQAMVPRAKLVRAIHNPIVDDAIELLAAEPLVPMWAQDDSVPMVLGVGRLAPEKDYATLMRGFALLRGRMNARLVIVGNGAERARLLELARTLGVSQDVYLPGVVSNPYALMRRAQVLAVTSLFEGFGNVLVEALACGTPVVATDCPVGPREILGQSLERHLVPIGDAVRLAGALEGAILNPPNSAELRERAGKFSAAASLQAYEDIIRAVAGKTATAADRHDGLARDRRGSAQDRSWEQDFAAHQASGDVSAPGGVSSIAQIVPLVERLR